MIRRQPTPPRGSGIQGEPFAPYPLLDFMSGLYDAKESWLAPRGAWDILENCSSFRGRVQKRKGYNLLAELCTAVVSEVLEATSVKANYTGTLANIPVCLPAGSYKPTFTTTDATAQVIYSTRVPEVGGLLAHTLENITPSLPFDLYASAAWPSVAFPPIQPGSFNLFGALGGFIGVDNGLGKIGGALVIGSVSFSTLQYATGFGSIIFPIGAPRLGPFSATYNEEIPGGGEIVHQDVTLAGFTLVAGTNVLSAQGNVVPGTLVVTDSSGTPKIITDDGAGGLVGATGTIEYDLPNPPQLEGVVVPGGWTNPCTVAYTVEAGFLNHATGVYDITFQANTAGGGNLEATYDYNRGLPVMGIRSFFDRLGNEFTIACDTRRVFQFNSTRVAFEDVDPGLADSFTAVDDTFPWFEPFEDALRISNGLDTNKIYTPGGSPPHVTPAGRDFEGDATDALESARIVLRGKDNSLIYLYTKEDGIVYPQRARFTEVNDVDFATATLATAELWVDCPTEDEIVTAERHGDDFLVGFARSFWRLAYTGQPDLPYEWRRIPSSDGALARNATVELSEEIITRGRTGIVSVDAIGETPIDDSLPDVSLSWSRGKANYSQAHHTREQRQVLFSYAELDADFPEKALVLQYDDKRTQRQFSIFDFPFHSIGEYRKQTSALWDDRFPNLMDSYNVLIDDPTQAAGFPVVLVGDRASRVYEWGVEFGEAGADTTVRMRTSRLNPYPFKQAHLGYIDLLLDFAASAGNTLTVNVYGNFRSTPYFSKTIDTTPTAAGATLADGKVKRRITVNKIASWHSIEIVETSTKPLKIDAIVPYFREVGLMRDVSP